MMFVVDDGETVVYQAGRVMPGKQGYGISRVLGYAVVLHNLHAITFSRGLFNIHHENK